MYINEIFHYLWIELRERINCRLRKASKSMSKSDKEYAFIYTMYMMFSSYYRKTNCTTPLLESKLHVYFSECKNDDQYHLEEKSIQLIEDELLPRIHDKLDDQVADVKIVKDKQDQLCIIFEGINRIQLIPSLIKNRPYCEMRIK